MTQPTAPRIRRSIARSGRTSWASGTYAAGMRRIIGTEVEYGISVPGDSTANPVLTSTQVVLAYAAAAEVPRAKRARWDHEVESPLRDARVFDLCLPGIAQP